MIFAPVGFFFFFSSRRRHTRLQGDWSSDVCSSDLKKKKNKSLFDARTKSYKQHKEKLEAARLKREAKKSKFVEKVRSEERV